MTTAIIAARYAGTCPQCREQWQPGDRIEASEPVPGSTGDRPRWQHALCPDPVDELALRPGERVCTTCFLTICDCESEN